jgi:hypothetical protein
MDLYVPQVEGAEPMPLIDLLDAGFPKPDPVQFARFKKTDRKTGQTGRYTRRLGLPWFLRSG